MNRQQIHSSMKQIFSKNQIEPDEEAEVRNCWTTRTSPPCFGDDERWGTNYRGLEPFDFCRVNRFVPGIQGQSRPLFGPLNDLLVLGNYLAIASSRIKS